MPLPSQRDIESALLDVISKAGGAVRPREIYDSVADRFPSMTAEERAEELDSGHNKFNNRVQWARQRLLTLGLLEAPRRGIWAITPEGQEALETGDLQNVSGPSAYILTWNPIRWPWNELPGLASRLARGEAVSTRWSTGNTRQIAEGDRLYLLRQGVEPRGLIGSGLAASDVYEEEHWDSNRAKAGDLANYVDIRFDVLLDPDRAAPLSPSSMADPSLQAMNWSPQSSGVRVPEAAIEPLERVWRQHLGEGGAAPILTARLKTSIPVPATPSLLSLMENHTRSVRRELKDILQGLDPYQFEHVSGQLLRAMGFRNVTVTARSADGGIDGHGQLRLGIVSVSAAFQCKRWQRAIGRPEVDAFRGATQGSFDQAILMTTSNFTQGAREAAVRPGCIPIVMLDGDALVDRMIEHGFGVTNRPLLIPQVDEDFFADREEQEDQDT